MLLLRTILSSLVLGSGQAAVAAAAAAVAVAAVAAAVIVLAVVVPVKNIVLLISVTPSVKENKG